MKQTRQRNGIEADGCVRYAVKRGRKYYRDDTQMRWTPYPQLAKLYKRRGWAEKAAAKWQGTVVELNGR